jgi:hypothetical protein
MPLRGRLRFLRRRKLVDEARAAQEEATVYVDALVGCINERGGNFFGLGVEHKGDRGVAVDELLATKDVEEAAGIVFALWLMNEDAAASKVLQDVFPGQGVAGAHEFFESGVYFVYSAAMFEVEGVIGMEEEAVGDKAHRWEFSDPVEVSAGQAGNVFFVATVLLPARYEAATKARGASTETVGSE